MRNLILISTGLTAVLAFSLGVFSLIKNPKSSTVRLWFLTSMAVTIWSVGYLKASMSSTDSEAFLALHVVYFGATLIPIFFCHFVADFLYKAKNLKYLLSSGYVLGLIFLILITFTKIMISGAQYVASFSRYEEIITPNFRIFLIYFLFFAVYPVILLIKNYKNSDGVRKRQTLFIILAAIFGIGGGISNFVTDLTGIYPYGQFVVWLYPILITYGIFVDELKLKIKI